MKRSCEQCGKKLDPLKARLDGVLGNLCGECALKNHQCFPLYRRDHPPRRDGPTGASLLPSKER
jgi:ribosome-binding protein aMBF1 (putative translation factor)